MAINSIAFIVFFLPFAVVVYYLCDDKIKPFTLFLLSMAFYAYNSYKSLYLIITIIITNIIIGRLIPRIKTQKRIKTALYCIGIMIDASILVFFKCKEAFIYSSSFDTIETQVKKSLIPFGLSFLAFKGISYLTDIYKEKIQLKKEFGQDLAYLSFFGQLTSGPISRYNDMDYVHESSNNSARRIEGIYKFITGFSKKVLIAGLLAKVTGEIFAAPYDEITALYAWVGSICWSLEIFYDFSGYSDMAIGLSYIFGFNCPENFIYPYTTDSVSKFWKKWHITLGTWFKDYIYIPMGGSKCTPKYRVYLNLLTVWLLTSFWHGVSLNYIIWGLCFFLLIVFEKATGLPEKFNTKFFTIIYRILVLLIINTLWILFKCQDPSSALEFIKKMFSPCSGDSAYNIRTIKLLKSYGIVIISALTFCVPILRYLIKTVEKRAAIQKFFTILKPIVLFSLFIISLSFVVAGMNNPFTYANF